MEGRKRKGERSGGDARREAGEKSETTNVDESVGRHDVLGERDEQVSVTSSLKVVAIERSSQSQNSPSRTGWRNKDQDASVPFPLLSPTSLTQVS